MPSKVGPGELALPPTVAFDPEIAAILHERGLEPRPIAVEDPGMKYVARVPL
jgi:hypothetical protein